MNANRIEAGLIGDFLYSILEKMAVRGDVSRNISDGLVQASLRGVDSHGIRLFPHYLKGFEGGRLNRDPKYMFRQTAAGTGKLDADHAPGHAAGMEGMLKAVEMAQDAGIGAVGVYHSSHFGAAAYYALAAAGREMIGMSFTHATAHVLPFGGVRPFLGNNPICLAAPCDGEGPFCLDMATTVATFNKVQQYKERGERIPGGWAVDKTGAETADPTLVESLLPIGGYKGFGLSAMVEVLCALLTGAPCGREVSRMFGTPMSEKRLLGHFFVAFKIASFEDPTVFKRRLKAMVDALRKEPRKDQGQPVMAPGDPEKACFEERSRAGIPVPENLLCEFRKLSQKYAVECQL